MEIRPILKAVKESLWEIRILIAFLILVNIYLFVLSKFFEIPTNFEDFINWIREFYKKYGYWVVLIAGTIEGLLLVNWYFPGSSAIMLGALFAGEGLLYLPWVILLGSLSLSLSSSFNYFLGKYGWYKLLIKAGFEKNIQSAKVRIQNKGLKHLFFWYFHPQLAVFVSTAAGILKYNLAKFLFFNLSSFFFWGTIWGISIFFIGPKFLKVLSKFFWPLIILLIIGWFLFRMTQKIKNKSQIKK